MVVLVVRLRQHLITAILNLSWIRMCMVQITVLIHKQMFTKLFDKKSWIQVAILPIFYGTFMFYLLRSVHSKMWLALVSDPVFDLCSMFPVLSLQEQHFKIPEIESIPTLHIKVYPTSLLCSFVKRVQAFEKNVFKIFSSLKKHTLYIGNSY